jgi:PAS domain S-box-containing protein
MANINEVPPERRLELLVDAVVDYAIFLLDQNGNIASWNSGAQRIKGYSAAEVIGTHFSIFYTPEDREKQLPRTALQTAAEKGKYESEGWRVRKDGSKFFASVVIDPVRSDTGELLGFAKVTRDITQRRSAEEQLSQAREQLLQSQKLESLGQLTGGVAHDFNNLLTVILSASRMIDRHAIGNEKVSEFTGHIRRAIERGEKLTSHLLAYSRKQSLKPQVLEVSGELRAFCEGILQTMRRDIEVTLDVPEELWSVEADPNELDLALLNIALNSRDAMLNGGRLQIRARNELVSPNGHGLPGHYVAISLGDTGTGMAPEIMERATEPFFTTKPPGAGTGLGLSQAYGFAKQSGGSLHIDSVLGKGTTVTIYLPAAELTKDDAPRQTSQKARTVLVVEDEVLLAEIAKAMLSEAGYHVEVAHNANQGLAIIRRSNIDAVFSDIVMPGGMNGMELAEMIRKERPEIPILLTTGYYQSPDNLTTRHTVLRKPYDESALLKALDEAFG